MIPKIMHQAFLSGDPPAPLRANVEAHIARNPGWIHMLWDERKAETFLQVNYGEEILRIYRMIDATYPAARVDLLCNLIVQHFGGVYFDIKSVFTRPLNEVLKADDRYLLAQWKNGPGEQREGWGLHRDLAHIPGGEYMKHFIVAEPNHPYSRAVVSKIMKNIADYRPWHAVGRTGTLRTTGPIAYTLGIQSAKSDALHRVVTEKEVGIEYSIGGGYNHQASLKKAHYSTMTKPIVTQGVIGDVVSMATNKVRELRKALLGTLTHR